ncbi:hypothetical protein VTN77DRAFT_9586 [Rasamsonia byssochlamydoides]|uniref:uncharacterized protein n=1 Tax=Rasamsonia byssochlamydoides TaxID=89139 RepID=UPI003743FA26
MGAQLSVPQAKCTVTVRIDTSGANGRPMDRSTVECSLELPLDSAFEIDILNDPPKRTILGHEANSTTTPILARADEETLFSESLPATPILTPTTSEYRTSASEISSQRGDRQDYARGMLLVIRVMTGEIRIRSSSSFLPHGGVGEKTDRRVFEVDDQ